MEEVDRFRKRVRSYAGFFMVVGVLQIVMGAAGYLRADYLTVYEEIFYWISGAFFVAGAIMAWNGARSGAIFILLWIILLFVNLLSTDEVTLVSLFRILAYLTLSILMCVNAFRHWRAARKTGAMPVRGAAWLRWAGLAIVLPVGALCVSLLAYSLMPQSVSVAILSGEDIPDDQLAWMRNQEFLYSGETPLLFYSHGLASIAEDGNLLTDRFVGSWSTDADGNLGSAWASLGTICEVAQTQVAGVFGIKAYSIEAVGLEEPFDIWLPVGDPLHESFLQRLDYLNDHNGNAELKAACAEDRAVNWDEVSRQNGLPLGYVDGADLKSSTLNWLRGAKFLTTDETPLWMLTHARFRLEEDGMLMTDMYFGGWEEEAGGLDAIWFEHGALCSIEEIEADSDEADIGYKLAGPGEHRTFKIMLPRADEDTPRKIAELREFTDRYQTEAHKTACETGIDPTGSSASTETADGQGEAAP